MLGAAPFSVRFSSVNVVFFSSASANLFKHGRTWWLCVSIPDKEGKPYENIRCPENGQNYAERLLRFLRIRILTFTQSWLLSVQTDSGNFPNWCSPSRDKGETLGAHSPSEFSVPLCWVDAFCLDAFCLDAFSEAYSHKRRRGIPWYRRQVISPFRRHAF